MVETQSVEQQDGGESDVLRRQRSGAPELEDQASRSPLELWRHIRGLIGGDTQRNTAEGTLLARSPGDTNRRCAIALGCRLTLTWPCDWGVEDRRGGGHTERLLAEETGDGQRCRRCTPECGGALVSADRILGHQQDQRKGTGGHCTRLPRR
ncbi:hypothetical protein NDU88_002485 [Pleurodeles waltl]|uniref:C2H2-type domain-containing protein n=1 Tax=Pleurodeles waltl TaxID=8319 RepID=A0AAV7LEB0_PLEWA|nr:hypothetical protein NDU88_002485 [Pleurodeles waltl]